ncbi:uncharacterized protein F4822DRAFT_176925 [Hypoxylon trugodes]|uniref:uncharacterized protein n=1 Tax=Hypoxylon trugodes TaxID=326681 RepID=UPI00219552F6|nr:uncharacterized protein F4822DRAFT_176925 [Hypoxylon trugodes]KAI1391179.1 hypothetical protein F4822DRAFT_176925 [Hypoxylon trugodes]
MCIHLLIRQLLYNTYTNFGGVSTKGQLRECREEEKEEKPVRAGAMVVNILSLSDEILLEIISYLRPIPPPLNASIKTGLPFFLWTRIIEQADWIASERSFTLNALASTCRRFYNVTLGTLYRHIPLFSLSTSTDLFLKSLQQYNHLSTYIRSVSIYAAEDPHVSRGMLDVFWLPNIHTICLHGWDRDDFYNRHYDYKDRLGTSTVQVLRLVACTPDDDGLSYVLRYPKALKEFWYDSSTFGSVSQAVTNQADSLEKIVYTTIECSPVQIWDGLINFPECTKLKSLSISHILLYTQLAYSPISVWENFPMSLEELEVHYDGPELNDFVVPGARESRWLFELLGMIAREKNENPKGELAPKLERIRLATTTQSPFAPYIEGTTRETIPNFDEKRGVGHPDYQWRPPAKLMRDFIKAGVSFSIYIDPEARYRYIVEGGKGFKDVWEDKWRPSADRFPDLSQLV